jgi:fatty-acyl-CoA synthase
MARFAQWLRTARDLAREEILRVRAARRFATRSGMLEDLTFDGVKAMIRGRGRSSPSVTIRFHAANSPHRTAVIDATTGRAYSYFELDTTVDRIAGALAAIGLGKGDSVVLMLRNVPEFLFLQLATLRLGAACVPVSWRSTAPELAYLLENSQAKAVFFDPDGAAVVRSALASAGGTLAERAFCVRGEVSGFGSYAELVRADPRVAIDDAATEESALLIYTSGTTGRPKGAVRKFNRDSALQVLSFIAETPLRVAQRHLTVCPLYHSTAYGFANLSLALGNTVVLIDFEPERFLDALERYRIDHTAVVPTLLHRTLALGRDVVKQRDTTNLRAIFSGGSPLSPTLAIDVMDAFGDKLFNFYGATETGFVTLATPHDLRVAPGTVGRCIGGNHLRLLDDNGALVGTGAVGELYVKSGNLVTGYHANDAATRDSMREGYFSVGDLAREDERGYLFLEGRKRDMIISGGVNVYPREVESVLAAHPSVGDVAVVGLPDPEWGERVHAFIEPRPGAKIEEDELLSFCREQLAGPKRPRGVTVLDQLPRNPTGKILKRELRALVG